MGVVMSDRFEIWLRTECFRNPPPAAYDLAKAAWIAGRRHGQGDTVMAKQITLDQANRVLAEAGMVAVSVDDMTEIAKFVKCGIGGNYGGIYYTEKMQEVYFPLLDRIKTAQDKHDA
jgi:hypothetical protein